MERVRVREEIKQTSWLTHLALKLRFVRFSPLPVPVHFPLNWFRAPAWTTRRRRHRHIARRRLPSSRLRRLTCISGGHACATSFSVLRRRDGRLARIHHRRLRRRCLRTRRRIGVVREVCEILHPVCRRHLPPRRRNRRPRCRMPELRGANGGLHGGAVLVLTRYYVCRRVQYVGTEIVVIEGRRIFLDWIVKPRSHFVFLHEQVLVTVVFCFRVSNLPRRSDSAGNQRIRRFSDRSMVLALHHNLAVLPQQFHDLVVLPVSIVVAFTYSAQKKKKWKELKIRAKRRELHWGFLWDGNWEFFVIVYLDFEIWNTVIHFGSVELKHKKIRNISEKYKN